MAGERLPDVPAERPAGSPSPDIRRARWLGLLFWLTMAPFALKPQLSGNVWSRYMTVESIVERRTLRIEDSPFLASSGSPDIVRCNGHFYSDKPPVLSVFGAVLYAPLVWLGIRFSQSPASFTAVNFVLVMLTATLSSAITVMCLRRLFAKLPLSARAADVLALGCGYGTLLFPYAVTFNNHAVAAGLITAAFLLLMERNTATAGTNELAWAGLLTGLAAVIDLPAGGACVLSLGAWLAIAQRRLPWAFAGGVLPVVTLHAVLQSMVTGSPLPAEFYPDSFLYPGSYWATEAGTFQEKGPRWRFGLEMLLGPQGWLTLTPVLGLGLVGLVTGLASKAAHCANLPSARRAVLAVLLPVLIYYVWFTRRTDFAGQSFGTRHLLAVSPLIYFFAVEWLSRRRSTARTAVFGLLMFIGAIYAYHGARDPWYRIENRQEPILRFLQRASLDPQSPAPPALTPPSDP